MRERTRPRDSIDPGNAEGHEGRGGQRQKLSEVRRKGEGLLQAAQDSIRKALSGDSRTFLAQGRQQGGQ